MPNSVLLNNIDHKDLRVVTRHGAGLGDAVMSSITFPGEFRSVQTHYPIVFAKQADGSFQALALFGFEQGQNLFLQGDRWDASYLPMAVERQPFMIGRNGEALQVHVDIDHPRIRQADGDGEAVFREHGGTSEYLEHINSLLLALHQGLQDSSAFVASLLQHDLLESFVLDVQLDDGSDHRLAGFYTINEEKLAALEAQVLAELHRAGHLQAIYMVMASLSNFRLLIDRMNHRRASH
ncbi:SapC family protein [Pseudoxanthomonas dokdonensis]|uniref:Peptidase n=1 Tax=Pseudoxanthomonas dokdonensis TaxID=344882 RepID=A0A0R0CYH4_9GAMM|nr:SapC family protein [Pseudoxanthomonas dokdonensis]KRG71482.1 peptidase [Pseudoxanthomonas dokdonensis]